MSRRPRLSLCLVAGLTVFATGCGGLPPSYPLPAQRTEFAAFRPYRTSYVINMSDADAQTHIVRDIGGSVRDPWRWTGPHPAVKLALKEISSPLKYTIDFTVADATFKDTGPVTVTFLVNDQVLDRVHYTKPGEQHFEKAVPAAWLGTTSDITLSAEPDKVWTSPGDGAKLGLILTRLGLAPDDVKASPQLLKETKAK
ncbi:MAG: hypothetical protein ABI824_13110 [Acidobacteriota bacterium]